MAPTENGKTILLAEDEQPVRTFVLAMLQKAGYNVIVAVDGRDGLDQPRQSRTRSTCCFPTFRCPT
jgi:CheY-like chemotaxis protein